MSLVLSTGPHLRDKDNVPQIMFDVVIALVPAIAASGIFFGIRALQVIVICVLVAMVTDFFCKKLRGRKSTVNDGSAIITGILLAMCLPPSIPFWTAAVGSFIAIAIAKEAFGGLGFNIFNPALVGRAFLLASYPLAMTAWHKPFTALLATTTSATPLDVVREHLAQHLPTYWDLFIGNRGGCLGETSVLALLLGAAYLFYKKVIDWRVPFSYIATVALMSWLFGQDPLFQVMAGGLVLGAFFMATDYVTSPMTTKGKLVFGIGAGMLVAVIRLWGGYPEGVCYSILIMNSMTPLLDRIKR